MPGGGAAVLGDGAGVPGGGAGAGGGSCGAGALVVTVVVVGCGSVLLSGACPKRPVALCPALPAFPKDARAVLCLEKTAFPLLRPHPRLSISAAVWTVRTCPRAPPAALCPRPLPPAGVGASGGLPSAGDRRGGVLALRTRWCCFPAFHQDLTGVSLEARLSSPVSAELVRHLRVPHASFLRGLGGSHRVAAESRCSSRAPGSEEGRRRGAGMRFLFTPGQPWRILALALCEGTGAWEWCPHRQYDPRGGGAVPRGAGEDCTPLAPAGQASVHPEAAGDR